ncbi:acrosomal protein SP-10-like [Lolium rigidum]|uniref:acrosomal protein SP-10-like n=1 Tax=Lolium rigidum TaxID=89674 RepID=UPI001F5E26C9|nr:acrosomal protein SP-10-like [Lolium rigidum]
MDSETGGDKEGNNETTSRKMIVGVIPTGDEPDGRDEDTSNAEQDHTQGEQQEHPTGDEPGGRDDDTSNAERDHTQGEQEEYQTERSRWPQNLKVYSRRQRAEDDQVQGEEEISLSQNPDAQIQPDLHDSSSSPSTSDGSEEVPHMERCHARRNGST